MDNELISLYSIYDILKNCYNKQLELRNLYVDKMNKKLENNYNKDHYIDKKINIFMCGYDYDHDELYILLKNTLNEIEKYYFSNNNNNFIITEYQNGHSKNKLKIIMDDLKELYEFFKHSKKLYDFYTEIKVEKTNLYVDFNIYALNLYCKKNTLEKKSYIKYMTYTNECDLCGNMNDFSFSSDNYINELKKIYIKKEDCPKAILKTITKTSK